MVKSVWITITEAFALRKTAFVEALRNGSIIAYNADNPAEWTVIGPGLWQVSAFVGEPAFPTLEGKPVAGMTYVPLHRHHLGSHIWVSGADVLALPKPLETTEAEAYDWLLTRAQEEAEIGRHLNQARPLNRMAEWPGCHEKTGITQKRYFAVFKTLPEQYRNKRGRPR